MELIKFLVDNNADVDAIYPTLSPSAITRTSWLQHWHEFEWSPIDLFFLLPEGGNMLNILRILLSKTKTCAEHLSKLVSMLMKYSNWKLPMTNWQEAIDRDELVSKVNLLIAAGANVYTACQLSNWTLKDFECRVEAAPNFGKLTSIELSKLPYTSIELSKLPYKIAARYIDIKPPVRLWSVGMYNCKI